MSWRTLIINKNSSCSIKDNLVVIKHSNQEQKIPLEEIKIILLNSNIINFSAPFFTRCLENKILLIHLSEKFLPLGYTCCYFNSYKPYSNLKLQIELKDSTRKRLWKNVIESKCNNQLNLLKILNYDVDLIEKIEARIESIKLDDKTNIEAQIAKEFFKNLYGNWFKRFDDSKVNSCLNFGYAIIVSELSRILAVKGFVLPLGIKHHGSENSLNLSYDLIEPYRAFVDYYIFFNILYNSNTNELTIKEKYKIVELLDEDIEIDKHIRSVSDSMWIYVESLISALSENNLDLLKFPEIKDINDYWDKNGL